MIEFLPIVASVAQLIFWLLVLADMEKREARKIAILERRIADLEAAFWEDEPPDPDEEPEEVAASNVVAFGRKAS